ncbi:hypothetical protein L518_0012 [Bordetella bronchiseptica MBORD675]|nr:hypothetical protein L576_0012 [Bordetella bronchiseptica OSU054]KDB74400.1 hypothetical protein L494_5143 [Bordetella bronchiseptica CA90 BB1334]KDC21505.1 hypothetical protein L542_0011 [Bordetella bronchiseptica F-1]KDC33000.1 hypothetical protein L504_0012 [Bordetella bronchiseptica F2]KDC63512.1 hypothetical protein L510_0011 [Bordetella bronchiseptica MBORD591]KDC92167.1 hypothetical protein L518_0012 [Bordetella bronchiseptica MBORD675]KDD42052.1 hypothetical protein L532_0011 [Bord
MPAAQGYTNLKPRFLPSSIMPIILRPFLSSLSLAVLALSGCANLSQPAAEAPATPAALQALAEVRTEYGAGHYGEVIRRVARSDELAAAPKAVRIEAFKLQAFSYCVSNYTQLCEDAFVRILHLDSSFTLAPNEAGHPAWGPVFRAAQSKAGT